MQIQSINDDLAQWYRNNRRDLPIRESRNPYIIWLAEVILQQTRMAQGMPYFHRFIETFPTVQDLAAAPLDEVLRLWQGLGYYSRARNLHACAKIVAEQGGTFPDSYRSLLKLPGIGPYTAAAIASLAFDEQVATLDGNAIRVFSRLAGIDDDVRKRTTLGAIEAFASKLIPAEAPADFNHAIMDLGSMVCKPNPDCTRCPLAVYCVARQHQQQHAIPYKSKAAPSKHRYLHYFVFTRNDELALKQRDTRSIWKGLYEFYLVELDQLSEVDDPAFAQIREHATLRNIGDTRHILSHQVLHVRFFHVPVQGTWLPAGMKYYSGGEIQRLPKPILIEKFLKSHFNSTLQIDNFNYSEQLL